MRHLNLTQLPIPIHTKGRSISRTQCAGHAGTFRSAPLTMRARSTVAWRVRLRAEPGTPLPRLFATGRESPHPTALPKYAFPAKRAVARSHSSNRLGVLLAPPPVQAHSPERAHNARPPSLTTAPIPVLRAAPVTAAPYLGAKPRASSLSATYQRPSRETEAVLHPKSPALFLAKPLHVPSQQPPESSSRAALQPCPAAGLHGPIPEAGDRSPPARALQVLPRIPSPLFVPPSS